MKKTLYFTLAVLAVAMPSAHAEKPVAEGTLLEVKGETGGAVAAEVEIKATITAIDKEKRTATVKLADGKTRTFPVSKEARNFDQAKVGDTLTLKYLEALVLKLEKAPGAKPGTVVTEELSRAKPGAKPGGKLQRTVTVVGTVTAIDAKTQVVTVRGPAEGEIDIKVADPAKLKNVKTGDLVRATYAEALIVSVTSPAKADAKK